MQKRRKSVLGSSSGEMDLMSISLGPKTKRKPAPKKKKREVPLKNDEAATIIQRAWRKHIVCVYSYLDQYKSICSYL